VNLFSRSLKETAFAAESRMEERIRERSFGFCERERWLGRCDVLV
jgi:hypothetical protein